MLPFRGVHERSDLEDLKYAICMHDTRTLGMLRSNARVVMGLASRTRISWPRYGKHLQYILGSNPSSTITSFFFFFHLYGAVHRTSQKTEKVEDAETKECESRRKPHEAHVSVSRCESSIRKTCISHTLLNLLPHIHPSLSTSSHRTSNSRYCSSPSLFHHHHRIERSSVIVSSYRP